MALLEPLEEVLDHDIRGLFSCARPSNQFDSKTKFVIQVYHVQVVEKNAESPHQPLRAASSTDSLGETFLFRKGHEIRYASCYTAL